MTRSIIVGASAGLGRALAEQLAAAGHALLLLASDQRDLTAIEQDLRIRFGVTVSNLALDLATFDPKRLHSEALSALGGVDNLFLVAGYSRPQFDRGPIAPDEIDRTLGANLIGAVQIANAFLPDLSTAPGGNLVGIGSVAAVRGRRNNMVYGAAKRGLESYFESCRHWLAAQNGARVQFYRMGYLKTSMTFGQKLPFPAIEPSAAARHIVANLGRDQGTRYLPRWWQPIALAIRLLPWAIFRRLDI